MTTLSFETIKNICTEFVNDSDTTIGMECAWPDYLVKWIELKDVKHTKEDIMQALNVNTTDYAVKVNVHHNQYGDMDVYIAIYDDGIMISTKECLLDEETYLEYLEKS